jgi:hypothetical protein
MNEISTVIFHICDVRSLSNNKMERRYIVVLPASSNFLESFTSESVTFPTCLLYTELNFGRIQKY